MSSNTLSLEQELLGLVASVFNAYSVVLFLPDAAGDKDGSQAAVLAASFSLGNKIIPDVRMEPGQGLVGWILRSRQPLMVPGFDGQHSNLDYYADGDEAEIKAFMGCPLLTGGALCVDSKTQNAFTDKEHKILQLFAGAIDSLQRSSGEAAAMGDIPGYFSRLGIIEDLRFRHKHWSDYIASYLSCLAEGTGFDYCSFASVNVPGESYCIEAENQPLLVHGAEPFFQAMNNGLAGWVFRNGQPVVHTGEDGRAPSLFGTSENLPEFAAVACLPVLINKATRGVISLGHTKPHPVDETMRTFLNQAVGHLSLYLENMYLRARLRSLMTKAQVYRDGPRAHDPDTSPYRPPKAERDE